MSAAVLDRVESLQVAQKSLRIEDWLALVKAYVDGELPDAERVAAIFDETGNGRADLERDGALLIEYRGLQAELDELPKLQAESRELGKQLSESLKERDAAELALRDAQEKVMRISNAASILNQDITSTRTRVILEMKEPKFHAINPAISASPEADELRREIVRREQRISELGRLIERKEKAYAALAEEADEVEGGDMDRKAKDERLIQINYSQQATRSAIERLLVEQQEGQHELALKRGKGRSPTYSFTIV